MKRKKKFRYEVQFFNYKNSNFLKKFISVEGKILPKFITLLHPKSQRKLSKAIKTSRIIGLLKFTNN